MKKIEIRLLYDQVIIKNIISNFVDEYWFAPQDCLLRGVETMLWANRYFETPVLDIGTGDGRNSRFLYAYNQRIDVGVDMDKKAVKVAEKSRIYNQVKVENAQKMSFKSSAFNTVISHSTFEHIEDDIKAVSEVSRILKKNGLFYLTVPLPSHPQMISRLGASKKEIDKYNERVQHNRYRSLEEWKKILKKNKLEVIYSKDYFSKEAHALWYKLHKIATYKVMGKELWSYLRDSRVKYIVPAFLIRPILKHYLFEKALTAFDGKGSWLFVVSRKK